MRFIRVDENNRVVSVRFGASILEGEIKSQHGELGQIMQVDGIFITPEPEPVEPQETLEVKLARIEETNFILMDALATVYEEVLMLRFELGGIST